MYQNRETYSLHRVFSQLISYLASLYIVYYINELVKTYLSYASKKHELFDWELITITIVILLLVIFQIFCVIKLILPPVSKYKFSSYQLTFHPIYFGRLNKIVSITNFIVFVIIPTLYILGHPFYGIFVFHLLIFAFILVRIDNINLFPVELLKTPLDPSKLQGGVNMIFEYFDYKNGNIPDDEPHLIINQEFSVTMKELPRNKDEENEIFIYNSNTPASPAFVTKICDSGLAELLRADYILKTRLTSIKKHGELEIMMWLEKNVS